MRYLRAVWSACTGGNAELSKRSKDWQLQQPHVLVSYSASPSLASDAYSRQVDACKALLQHLVVYEGIILVAGMIIHLYPIASELTIQTNQLLLTAPCTGWQPVQRLLNVKQNTTGLQGVTYWKKTVNP